MSRLIRIHEHKIGRRAPEFLNLAEIKRRGWTEKLIRQFAGPADHLAVNPHHPGGPAMRLYQTVRIQEIEASPAFVEAREIADRRRTAAKKGLQTKAQNAAAAAAENIAPPVLPPASRAEIEAAAIVWFNTDKTWRSQSGTWLSPEDPDAVLFPIVIDFIRDRLQDYRERARPIGLPIEQAEAAVDAKIVEAIAACYPWLGAGAVHVTPEARR